MRIGILSRTARSYSARRLREAGTARKHRVRIYDTLRFSIAVERQWPELYYRHRRLPALDAVVPRIGASITFFGLAVVRQFEQMGVYTANESIPIARARDKLRAMQLLSRHDIGVPSTVFVRDRQEVLPAIERVGGPPVIIKVLEGTQGVGVILADTEKVAEAIVQTLQSARQNVLIQKFVKESKGQDIRAIVVGDRVVAAMRRKAVGDEFRSNVHRGASASPVTLEPEYEQVAIRAAQVIGLRIAGVDILESNEGPQVLEVNSSPGLEAIEAVTGADVAGAIIEDVEHQVLFPEVDLRQRLRLTGGYGVAEFRVHKMPELEGHALRDTTLAEQNVHVLMITRKKIVIHNPTGDHIIRRGDVLLCYGDLHVLRSLVPQRKPRRPRAPQARAPRRPKR
ncbi:MAG: RimK family alpha-L-glutamate ligase [Candidatus Hydrogenedentes bacterium]|nr:RimK family alpha-L-glutamate ligase [Candidatus Hydrogenedentota bacterium]